MYVPKSHPDGGFDVKTRVTNQEISYLLTTAFEGGMVSYWCIILDHIEPEDPTVWMDRDENGQLKYPDAKPHRYYDWPLSKGGAIVIAEVEEYYAAENKKKVKKFRIDRDKIQAGLNVMMEKYPTHFANFLNDNTDAITGDVFLQCCAFGEVIYG